MEVLWLIKSITWHLSLEAGNKEASAGSLDAIAELPKVFLPFPFFEAW